MVSNTSCGCDQCMIGYSDQHGWTIGPRHLSCSGIHSSLILGESQGCPPVRVHSTASRMTCDQEKSARHLERSAHSVNRCQHQPQRHWYDHTNRQEHKNCEEFQDARRIVAIAFRERIAELSPLSYDLTDKLVEPVTLGSQDGLSGFNVASTCITYMSQTFKRTCLQDM